MITNEEMRERVEKAFEVLGRNPTVQEYAEYLFPNKTT